MPAESAACVRGSWEPHSAACVCEYGWVGKRCERFALDECLTSSAHNALHAARADVICTVGRPLSCGCVIACIQYGAFPLHISQYCFQRKAGAPPPPWLRATFGPDASLRPSDIPLPEEAARGDVTFFRWRSRVTQQDGPYEVHMIPEPDVELALRFRDNKCCRVAPLAACKHLNFCSRSGTCVVRVSDGKGAYCMCDTEHQGSKCEVYATTQCYNNCTFRGRCIHGGCVCEPGTYGPACALPISEGAHSMPGRALAMDEHQGSSTSRNKRELLRAHRRMSEKRAKGGKEFRERLLLFAYHLPRLVTFRRSWASDWDHQRLFQTMDVFMERLLVDSAHLAETSDAAHLHVVPAWATNMEGLPEYYSHVLRHVRADSQVGAIVVGSSSRSGSSPPSLSAYHTTQGVSHVWACSSDHGGDMMQTVRGINHGITLAHYWTARAYGDGSRAVVQAPYLGIGITSRARRLYGASNWTHGRGIAAGGLTLFFAGTLALEDKGNGYSEGVRRALYFAHNTTTPGFKIVKRSSDYNGDYLRSLFCAAPLGEGWGIRLIYAVAFGCIPVLFRSPKGVRKYFDDLLPYDDFSISVTRDQISSLREILESIPSSRIASLQQGLARYHRYLLWDPPYGLAYETTLHSLCIRARDTARASSGGDRGIDGNTGIDIVRGAARAARLSCPLPPGLRHNGRERERVTSQLHLEDSAKDARVGRLKVTSGSIASNEPHDPRRVQQVTKPEKFRSADREKFTASAVPQLQEKKRHGKAFTSVVPPEADPDLVGTSGPARSSQVVIPPKSIDMVSQPTCSARCEDHEVLYAQIESDMAQWNPRGINSSLIDEALKKWGDNDITVAIAIINGSLYLTQPTDKETGQPISHSNYQTLGILDLIWDILHDPTLPTPPDLELIINCDDYGRAHVKQKPPLPLLSITKEVGIGADILYPAGHYVKRGGKWANDIGKKAPLGWGDSTLYRSPWESKRPIGFFRGRPNTHTRSRYSLSRLAAEGTIEEKAWLDVGLVFYTPENDPFIRLNSSIAEWHRDGSGLKPRLDSPPRGVPLPLLSEATPMDHLGYRYLISLEGNSYANRLIKLLATNSLVVKEMTPTRQAIEFYYHLLKPFEHYVPFGIKTEEVWTEPRRHRRKVRVTTNITAALKAAFADDSGSKAIAERASALMHTHLCADARRCYMHRLLMRYGRAMAYRPDLSRRPRAVKIEDRIQLERVDKRRRSKAPKKQFKSNLN